MWERQKAMISSCLVGRQQQTTEKVLNSWGNFSHSLFFSWLIDVWDKFAGKEGRVLVSRETSSKNYFSFLLFLECDNLFSILHLWNTRWSLQRIENKSMLIIFIEFPLNEVLVLICKQWNLDLSPKTYFVIPPMLWMARSNENHQLEIILD